jgi:A/G-specific adenine glycosylase
MTTAVRDALLAWYDRVARDLPWRRTRDPYAIWVSEIMCQQTRVDTVIPYYERFVARFPTATVLARAEEDEVMSLWSGLGYYRRARLLHAGVKEVVASYGGEVPRAADARRALPGVGRYTAGAIGSVAFELPEPVVDGNVARVLARVHEIDTPLGAAATEKRLWTEAGALVVGPRPGDLNQALMELGATVCAPRSPRCGECPIEARCRARASGRVDELPVARKKKKPEVVALTAVVARAAHRTWLVRGEGKLFGGLFGVLLAEGRGVDVARSILDAHGLVGDLDGGEPAFVEQVLTHRILDVQVHVARRVSGRSSPTLRAFDAGELTEVGVATLTRKILDAAAASQLDLFRGPDPKGAEVPEQSP